MSLSLRKKAQGYPPDKGVDFYEIELEFDRQDRSDETVVGILEDLAIIMENNKGDDVDYVRGRSGGDYYQAPGIIGYWGRNYRTEMYRGVETLDAYFQYHLIPLIEIRWRTLRSTTDGDVVVIDQGSWPSVGRDTYDPLIEEE